MKNNAIPTIEARQSKTHIPSTNNSSELALAASKLTAYMMLNIRDQGLYFAVV